MKICGLKKTYGNFVALDIPDLEIAEGEITAVLGESGAGKTTLLNAIAAATSFEGKAEGAGRVSYLFQSPCLLPNLTAEGNLKFVLPKEEWKNIPKALARVGLAGKEKSYPHALSGGERQRVAIARAFLFSHDTLLMDEPFSSLDLGLKQSLSSLVTELWQERGSTVVFVTHDVHEAVLLARRALVLKKGKIVFETQIARDYPRDFFARFEEEEGLIRALVAGGEE